MTADHANLGVSWIRIVTICGNCRKAQATIHLTDIRPSGEKIELHLCERCAEEHGVILKPSVSHTEQVAAFLMTKGAAAEIGQLTCEHCGMSYVEFRNQGLLGCPHDYDSFGKPLAQMIEKAHDGATHHVGKRSPTTTAAASSIAQRPTNDLRRLKKMLQEAVAAEDYERAAELRDRIREAEES